MKNTRSTIIKEVVDFLTSLDVDEKRIFLLSGCAGSGKTAIAHSVAYICAQMHHSLGASFFFQAGHNLQNNPKYLIVSLARELSARNPEYAACLSEAIEAYPGIVHSSLANQFHCLLLRPASQVSAHAQPTAIVIDALDEGWSESLLDIIKSCANLPSWLRIFITVRDDASILTRLRTQTHISRREIDISSDSNHRDVRVYVGERLRTIASDRNLVNWPTNITIDRMCNKADGLFVWAAVACNSIADIDLDPLEQFEELVGGGPLRDTKVSSRMDDLYLKVLSKCHLDEPRALSRYHECVGTLLALKRPLSIPAIDKVLGNKHAQLTYRPLSSVLPGLMNQPHPIQIIHHSFREFITQEVAENSPSKKYMVVPSEHNKFLALHCLKIIREELPIVAEHTELIVDEERDTEGSILELREGVISEALWYACEYVMEHIDSVSSPTPDLSEALAHFLRNDSYGWIAVCAMKGKCQESLKLQRYWQVRTVITS